VLAGGNHADPHAARPTRRAPLTKEDSMVHSRLARLLALPLVAAAVVVFAAPAFAQSKTSKPFSGAKVNGGTVTMTKSGGTTKLTLSGDFKVPDTPDPHWQVVDSKGTVYVLQRLGIKGDKVNTTITLPAYVPDVASVEIYCSWAEAVLGTAPFGGAQTTD
jgi:hypothetical protein